MKRAAHVYLVTDHTERRTKIGFTTRLPSRLAGLQTGSADQLRVAHSWTVPQDGARPLERELHRLFKFARLKGEWFLIDPIYPRAVGDVLIADRGEQARELAGIIARLTADTDRMARIVDQLQRTNNRQAYLKRDLNDEYDRLAEATDALALRGFAIGLLPDAVYRFRIKKEKGTFGRFAHLLTT